MKSNFTTIALVSVLAFVGSSSFAGSGNDEQKPVTVTQSTVSIQISAAPLTAADFDPGINTRVEGNYPLFSA